MLYSKSLRYNIQYIVILSAQHTKQCHPLQVLFWWWPSNQESLRQLTTLTELEPRPTSQQLTHSWISSGDLRQTSNNHEVSTHSDAEGKETAQLVLPTYKLVYHVVQSNKRANVFILVINGHSQRRGEKAAIIGPFSSQVVAYWCFVMLPSHLIWTFKHWRHRLTR